MICSIDFDTNFENFFAPIEVRQKYYFDIYLRYIQNIVSWIVHKKFYRRVETWVSHTCCRNFELRFSLRVASNEREDEEKPKERGWAGGRQRGSGMKSLGSVIGKRWFTIIGAFPSLVASKRRKEVVEKSDVGDENRGREGEKGEGRGKDLTYRPTSFPRIPAVRKVGR